LLLLLLPPPPPPLLLLLLPLLLLLLPLLLPLLPLLLCGTCCNCAPSHDGLSTVDYIFITDHILPLQVTCDV
jgi:hypothetical protein